MNLIRVLIIALLVWLVYRMIRAKLNKPSLQHKSPRATLSTDMVRCHHCGIHIPANEALQQGEHYYCSAEHRDQDNPPGT